MEADWKNALDELLMSEFQTLADEEKRFIIDLIKFYQTA